MGKKDNFKGVSLIASPEPVGAGDFQAKPPGVKAH